MATYTVQAPDGKTITLEGPEGASEADIFAQAQKLYQPKAAPAPKPAAPKPLTANAAQVGLDRGSAILEEKIKNFSEKDKRAARDIYFQRTADLRVASATPASQKRNAQAPQARIEASAQQRSKQNVARSRNFLTALKAGVTRGAFGIPERLAAAGERFLPSAITGNTSDASYDEILNQVRANTDADLEQSFAGNILGQILSGAAIGGAAAKGVSAIPGIGSRLAAARAAAPARTALGTAVASGTAGGAAQALGEGSDVITGAATGAIAAPIGLGAAKAVSFVARPIGDLLGMPSAGKILRRFTKDTKETLQARADEFRRATGAEPTLYEIMSLADRNAIGKQVFGASPEASERTVAAVRQRIGNIGEEMQGAVRGATGNERVRILGQMADDLEAARGTPRDAAPLPGMENSNSPRGIEAVRREEANAIMRPFDDETIVERLSDFYPTEMRPNANNPGQIDEVYSNPDINSLIQSAAGALRLRPQEQGLTVREVMSVIDKLSDVPPTAPNYLTAQSAVNHLIDTMTERNPAVTEAAEQMRSAYAARSRMMEGMAEGGRTRTEASIPVESRSRGQLLENVFDTPEGAAGRQLGQTNALNRELSGTVGDVGRTLENVTGSGETQRALAQNLGPEAAGAIEDAAGLQAQSARRLASIGRESGQEADNLDLEDLGRMVLALNPAAMPTTRLFALSRLTQLTRMPEGKARQIVDLMLSQDPATTNRAISLLNSAGDPGRQFLKEFRNGVMTGQLSSEVANSDGGASPSIVPEANAAEIPVEVEVVEEEIPVEEPDDRPYGRAVIEGLFPEAVVTDDVRDPNSKLGRANPGSYHVKSDEAVDVRPIPGMTFEEFIQQIEDAGYTIIEAINEDEGSGGKRSAHATGNHWHVVVG